MTNRNSHLAGTTRTSISNGCYVDNEDSMKFCRVPICGHDSIAGFHLALLEATRRICRPYFKYTPRICSFIDFKILVI